LYWESISYATLFSAGIAAVVAVVRQRSNQAVEGWHPAYGIPIVLSILAVAASLAEPVMVEAFYPLLFVALYALVVYGRPRVAPMEVVAGTLGVYAVGLAALKLPPVWPEADPRLLPYLWLVLGLSVAAAALAAAGLALLQPPRALAVLQGCAVGAGLALLGLMFLLHTRASTMLYGDPLSLGLAGALMASIAAAAFLGEESLAAYGVGLFALAAALYRLSSAGYVRAPGFEALGYWLGVYLVVVGLPRLLVVARKGSAEMFKGMWHWLFAGLLLGVASLASTTPYSALVPIYAAAAAMAGFGQALGLLAGIVASSASFVIASSWHPYMGVLVASIASLAVVAARRCPPPRVAAVLLLAGLALAAYTGAGWNHESTSIRLTPVGLGSLAETAKPDPMVVHDYFMLYLGAKNESVLYSLLVSRMDEDEALEIVRFAHAIRVLAEKRGIHDAYNLTQLTLPEKMPSLLVRVEPPGVVLHVPPSVLLSGSAYGSGVARAGLSLARVGFDGNVTLKLARGYLALVSDPSRTDGDALRYAIYTAMAVSWAMRGNLSATAPLLLSALNGSLTASPLYAVADVVVLRFGLLAALASGVLLAVAPVAAARETIISKKLV